MEAIKVGWLKSLWLMFVAPLFKRKQPQLRPPGLETEAACEVVRIISIEPHGNADKLEVARFEMATGPTGYEVIVQRNTWKPGDLAIYLSVDCIVPIKGAFAFLGERQDGRDKTQFRLRAARLRGRYSQGLLVPNDLGLPVGAQCWEQLGVTYHRPPEPTEEAPLIQKPRPQPIPVYGVDSLKKAPNLFDDVGRVMITEKIHGTNFRFGWIRRRILGIPCGWRFVVGSHRVIKEGGGENWYGEDVWTKFATQNDLAKKTKEYKGHVFYGELYGHTYGGQPIQDLTYGRKPSAGPALAIFDVLTPKGWMDPLLRFELCLDIGFPHVPVLWEHVGVHNLEALAEGPSLLPGASQQIREGIVVETIDEHPRRKAKFVSQAYHLRKEAQ